MPLLPESVAAANGGGSGGVGPPSYNPMPPSPSPLSTSNSPRARSAAAPPAALSPRFDRLAELMWAMPNAPSTFRFAKINARANELPPPHGHKIRRSSLFLYPGVERTTEQVSIEWLEPVEHDLAHILAQLKSAFTLEHSRRHVANLYVALGEELVHAATWWEDPRLLDAVRRADNGQRPTPLKPRHERKNEL